MRKATRYRADAGSTPDWWPGVLALQRKVRRAEKALELARQDRNVAVWLVLHTGACSIGWLAARLGMARPPVLRLSERGGEIVRRRGWTPEEVASYLNLASRVTRSRVALNAAEEDRALWLANWSAPPPPPRRGSEPRVAPSLPLASDGLDSAQPST